MTAEQILKLLEKYEKENPPLSPYDIPLTEDNDSLDEPGYNYAHQMDVNVGTEKKPIWNFRAILARKMT